MKRIPIAAAKRIAEQYGYDQVVIYARKVDVQIFNGQPVGTTTANGGGEAMTTYGVSKVHCGIAARMGKVLQDFMGWKV